jgi:hypothetical protein
MDTDRSVVHRVGRRRCVIVERVRIVCTVCRLYSRRHIDLPDDGELNGRVREAVLIANPHGPADSVTIVDARYGAL